MGWSLPDVSLEDLLKLIKGFVDILILASGYQSSGLHAHWDSHSIRKAFQWGLFFEDVCRRLRGLEDFHDSVKELDAALSELKSNPIFPQGLVHLSFASLSRGSEFVLEHLIHTMPLRDGHLRAFLNSIIEMDFDEVSEIEDDCLPAYLDKLKLLNTLLNPLPSDKDFMEVSMITSPETVPHDMKVERCAENVFTKLAVQELIKRQLAVSRISLVESGLYILSARIRSSNWNEPGNLSMEKLQISTGPLRAEQLTEYATWSYWMSKNLSYLFDKRTVRLVSGASMIFSSPKMQWMQVFQRMNISLKSSDDDSSEAVELLLLGCVASRWSQIIEYLMAISFASHAISKQYRELCNTLGRSKSLHCKEETMNSKENAILEYLAQFLGGQLHQLWKQSPALIAAAIPSWSPLFGLYLSEIDTQFKGEASLLRCCSCTLERKEHKECELAERIWCLYAFHVCGSHLMLGASCA